jgi:hypothetical protein
MDSNKFAIDLYVQATIELEPRLQPVALRLSEQDYIVAMHPWTLFKGPPAAAVEYITANPGQARKEGLSSLYLTTNGEVLVLHPHRHNLAAFYALAANCQPDFQIVGQSLAQSKVTFRDLTAASGIVRAQLYAPPHAGGLGVSVVEPVLLTLLQMRAVLELYDTTAKEVFVAEIYRDDELVSRILDPDELEPWVEEAPMLLGASRQLAEQKRRHLEEVRNEKHNVTDA